MRGLRIGIQSICAIAFGLAGCQTQNLAIKQHPLQEEYILPPADDPRFSNPPQYPKEVLDQDLLKKNTKPGPDQPGGPPKFGAGGSGMGGQ